MGIIDLPIFVRMFGYAIILRNGYHTKFFRNRSFKSNKIQTLQHGFLLQVLPGDILRAVTERVEDETAYLERKYLQYTEQTPDEDHCMSEEEDSDEDYEDAVETLDFGLDAIREKKSDLRRRKKVLDEDDSSSSSGFGSHGSSSSESEESNSS